MKIGFNPAIKNQNLYSTKRNVSEHANISNNQLAFKKVNQEFYNKAQKSYNWFKDISSQWYEWLTDAVVWNEIPKQDALDTMNAVRKWVRKESLDSHNATYYYIQSLIK